MSPPPQLAMLDCSPQLTLAKLHLISHAAESVSVGGWVGLNAHLDSDLLDLQSVSEEYARAVSHSLWYR